MFNERSRKPGRPRVLKIEIPQRSISLLPDMSILELGSDGDLTTMWKAHGENPAPSARVTISQAQYVVRREFVGDIISPTKS